jgi:hypothetical protein
MKGCSEFTFLIQRWLMIHMMMERISGTWAYADA